MSCHNLIVKVTCGMCIQLYPHIREVLRCLKSSCSCEEVAITNISKVAFLNAKQTAALEHEIYM